MKVLVCGGRNYGFEEIDGKWKPCPLERAIMWDYLNVLHRGVSITHIIHGMALGADSMADEWAREHGSQRVLVPADWDALGKRAGPVRNRRMLELLPDVVVAFPGGAGTAHLVKSAQTAGVEVYRVAEKAEYKFADLRLKELADGNH